MSKSDDRITIIVFVVAGIVILGILFGQPYFEARAFNKFRKPGEVQATYWDAMFSNLRIGVD